MVVNEPSPPQPPPPSPAEKDSSQAIIYLKLTLLSRNWENNITQYENGRTTIHELVFTLSTLIYMNESTRSQKRNLHRNVGWWQTTRYRSEQTIIIKKIHIKQFNTIEQWQNTPKQIGIGIFVQTQEKFVRQTCFSSNNFFCVWTKMTCTFVTSYIFGEL